MASAGQCSPVWGVIVSPKIKNKKKTINVHPDYNIFVMHATAGPYITSPLPPSIATEVNLESYTITTININFMY